MVLPRTRRRPPASTAARHSSLFFAPGLRFRPPPLGHCASFSCRGPAGEFERRASPRFRIWLESQTWWAAYPPLRSPEARRLGASPASLKACRHHRRAHALPQPTSLTGEPLPLASTMPQSRGKPVPHAPISRSLASIVPFRRDANRPTMRLWPREHLRRVRLKRSQVCSDVRTQWPRHDAGTAIPCG